MLNKNIFNDHVIRGAIAGSIGGIVMEIINLVLLYFDYLKLWSADFVTILIQDQKAANVLDIFSGLTGHLLNSAAIAVILELILNKTNFKYSLIKGAGIGLSTNYAFLYLSSILNAEQIINTTSLTIFLYHITATIYGIAAAYILKLLYQKYGPVN